MIEHTGKIMLVNPHYIQDVMQVKGENLQFVMTAVLRHSTMSRVTSLKYRRQPYLT